MGVHRRTSDFHPEYRSTKPTLADDIQVRTALLVYAPGQDINGYVEIVAPCGESLVFSKAEVRKLATKLLEHVSASTADQQAV